MGLHPAHRVKRVTLFNKLVVYRCMDNCTSYFQPAMMADRLVKCWSCLKPFIFSERNLRQAKPRCGKPECANPKSPAAKALYTKRLKQTDVTDNILKRLAVPPVVKPIVEEEEEAAVPFRQPGVASDDLLRRLGLKVDDEDSDG